MVKEVQQLLLDRSEDFARLITLEMGRPYIEAFTAELEASIDLVAYYANKAGKYLSNRNIPLSNVFFKRRESYFHYQPLWGYLGSSHRGTGRC